MQHPCEPVSAANNSIARQLLPSEAPLTAVCGLAALLEGISHCNTVAACSFYWVFSVLLFGVWHRGQSLIHTPQAKAWDDLHLSLQKRIYKARAADLWPLARQQLDLYGHTRPPPMPALEQGSVLLLYGDSPAYFEQPEVSPFVRQLRCYASTRGMRFAIDSKGPRVQHKQLARLDVSIQGEFFVGTTATDHAMVAETSELVADLFFRGRHERARELQEFEGTMAVHYSPPLHFGRIWAIEDKLSKAAPGALVIYFDSDVTIRPDSWHKGIVQRLLEQRVSGKEAAHVFVADTWIGTECVNSGFVAIRNTRLGRRFLELWREKLWWAASWDQAALAETLLEFTGAEAWKLSGGTRHYDSHCAPLLLPVVDGTFSFTRYCDCWQGALESLVGPYRRRQSRLVSFVDPEVTEVNFIPNNLFWDHNYQLNRMTLVPQAGRPHFRPLVVHWAGLGFARLGLMRTFLKQNFNFSARSCPQGPRWAAAALAAKPELTARRAFGSRARQLRCCEKLRHHADRRGWPWTEPSEEVSRVVHWWGCSEWGAVTAEDCAELLGRPIVYAA
mmetsp:Transcript_73024/g.144772  ORF Transcript_73024/g.144772 Transcript_73024/m.144772 type:complete len:559 (+) Transcript_73024:53-1729(+)